MCASSRETRLWIAAAVLVAFTYSTLYLARFATEWLRAQNLLRMALAVVFALVAGWVVRMLVRARPGRRELALLAVVAVIYASLFLLLKRAEEAMHFVQYGLLGGLFYAALDERRRRLGPGGWLRRLPMLSAAVLTLALGWGDEGLQHLLPNRYYDLRDVAFNGVAGALAVIAMAGRGWAREQDRRGREATAAAASPDPGL